MRSVGRPGIVALALFGLAAALAASSGVLAQGMSEQQIRCMQLQQELAAASGGGAGGEELALLQQQISEQDRIYQGTQATMEDAGCYERLFIFGRALKRNPRCLSMNARVEDARRQLARLQEQSKSLQRGGGNKRRQAELQQAMQRSGCSGAPARRGGGLFDFFGGDREPDFQTPVYRSINPNGRYRSVCVRLCDGFYYPISYSTYGSRLEQDKAQCESNCAAPAELYVYRNPGQEIEQAISLHGSAYMDLPVALKFRKEYVKGCSCKQAEYNPTDIEAANKKAAAEPADGAAQTAAAVEPAADAGEMPQLDLDITGSTEPPPAAEVQQEPATEVTTEIAPPPAPPEPGQSVVTKQPRAAAD